MTLHQAINIVRVLQPIYDVTGVNGNRAITDKELKELSEASDLIRNSLCKKELFVKDLLVYPEMGNIVKGMVIVGFGMQAESTQRMLDARKQK